MALIGIYSVPKFPISFNLGSFDNTALDSGGDVASVTRITKNCRTHTGNGTYTKTIIRGLEREGPSNSSNEIDGLYLDHVVVDDVIYLVTINHLFQIAFYSYDYSTSTDTLIGLLATDSIQTQYKLATNGKNVVLVRPYSSELKTSDYYYDIATNTLATINSLDPNYSSFEKATDVVFKDGYYVFITDNTVFHGDNASIGTGLSFNVLSFSTLPSGGGAGRAINVSGGQLVAMTDQKTFFYSNTGSVPFAFSINTQVELSIGTDFCHLVFEVEDKLLLIGRQKHSGISVFLMSGSSYSRISNTYIDKQLLALNSFTICKIGSYVTEGHRIASISYADASYNYIDVYSYDLTESEINGYPIWHVRDDSFKTRDYADLPAVVGFLPIIIKSEVASVTDFKTNITSLLSGSDEGGELIYTLPKISNNGEPVFIKSIGLKFNRGVFSVELQSRLVETGGAYVSLGSFDLSPGVNNLAEWRKINRRSTDVEFRFTITHTSGRFEMLEGYIIT